VPDRGWVDLQGANSMALSDLMQKLVICFNFRQKLRLFWAEKRTCFQKKALISRAPESFQQCQIIDSLPDSKKTNS